MTAKAEQQPHLQDQAATAALYVTKPKSSSNTKKPILDEDGKLSSASAALSLKYAKPTDLPSFPSAGLKFSSAGAAASLANNNQKQFEHWKPGQIPAAEKAAHLAKDYQADPLWQPEMSQAGSKAAILAARDGGNVEIWQPVESEYGQSAAGLAASKKGLSPTVKKDVPLDSHRRALMAATGAMSGSRRRAESAPQKPVDLDDPWALQAATRSHRDAAPSGLAIEITDPAINASRIHNIAKSNVSRQMYTSNPPVSIEVEEKKHQDTLRASAVAMARKMYAIQQDAIDQAKKDEGLSGSDSHHAAIRSHNRRLSTNSDESEPVVRDYPQYTNLQDAAMKLAQERLAKLQPNSEKEYRQYYGTDAPARSRLHMRGSLRRRASSDGTLDNVDEEQSNKIRSQMSLFRTRIDEIDGKKRQKDREDLMALAQKNVSARMSTMDEKVFQEKGIISESQMVDWERKARAKAEQDSATRMENYGKVNIGAGQFIDQSAVEAVARSRLQPTFDDIAERAAEQRARDEEIRLEQEEKKRVAERERAREAETKAELKKAKEHEKEEERARKAEEKRLAQEEKRKSKDQKGRSFGALLGFTGAGAATTQEEKAKEDEKQAVGDTKDGEASKTEAEGSATNESDSKVEPVKSAESPVARDVASKQIETTDDEPVSAATPDQTLSKSPEKEEAVTSPNRRSWFSRFKRNKGSRDLSDQPGMFDSKDVHATSGPEGESENAADNSMRDVAMAGRTTKDDDEDMYAATPPVAVATAGAIAGSPVSPINSEDEAAAARASTGPIEPAHHGLHEDDDNEKDEGDDDEEDEEDDDEPRGRQGRPKTRNLKQRLLEKMHRNKDKDTPQTAASDDKKDDEDDEGDDAFEEAQDSWDEQDDKDKAKDDALPTGSAYMAATLSDTDQKEDKPTSGHASKFSEVL